MAKFAVGDLVEVISCDIPHEQFFVGMRGEVKAVGKWRRGERIRGGVALSYDGGEVVVQLVGHDSENLWHEYELRELPPDSHADDTTEDPGVTRLKKLLKQDAVKVKKPATA